MSDDGLPRRELLTKGLFVVVGVGYAALGPPFVGLEPAFVGSALVAYGVVGFVGGRLIGRWRPPDRD
ncbi:MAG: hypothetical protein U5J98_03865 [Halobacteriales archaeon]|nr:hypothetical protein [Halobacteriales archaeon]